MNLPFTTLLALRQLRHLGRGLIGAFAGVCVAIILVFVQFGFQNALLDSVLNFGRALDADLVITGPQFESMAYTPPWFPRAVVERARAVSSVAEVTPLWITIAQYRLADQTTGPTAARFIAFEPRRRPLHLDTPPQTLARLHLPDTLLIDARSRGAAGALAARVAQTQDAERVHLQSAAATLAARMDMVGTFSLGPDFTLPTSMILSDLNYYRLFRSPLDRVTLAAVKLAPGAAAPAVLEALRTAVQDDARVQTRAAFIDAERAYFQERTPIGVLFSFGIGIGIFIGVVFVLEVLRGIIDTNLSEYAVLNAMGYGHGFFASIVLQIAGIVAVLAFLPSLAITALLYEGIGHATQLAFRLTPSLSAAVFAATLLMSAMAVLLALRKLRRSNPIDLFA